MSIPGIPTINFPSDMRSSILRLGQDARGVDDAVRACGALDQATRAAWGDFYIGLIDFTTTNANPGVLDMTSSLMHRAESYGIQLYDWQVKISKVCAAGAPVFNPSQLTPEAQQAAAGATLSTFSTIAQWLAVGAIAIGGAYAVGKVVSIIPHKQLAK